jgi:hypothetical protein
MLLTKLAKVLTIKAPQSGECQQREGQQREGENPMKTPALAAIAAALVLAAAPTVSRANLVFDFSFTGDKGGKVTGEIDLPGNPSNATVAATSVFIDSASIAFPYPLPFNTINTLDGNSIDANHFTFTDGQLTGYNYTALQSKGNIPPTELVYSLSLVSLFGVGSATLSNQNNGQLIDSSNPPTLTQQAREIPEPSTLALLGTALAGLFLLKFRAHRQPSSSRWPPPSHA